MTIHNWEAIMDGMYKGSDVYTRAMYNIDRYTTVVNY